MNVRKGVQHQQSSWNENQNHNKCHFPPNGLAVTEKKKQCTSVG